VKPGIDVADAPLGRRGVDEDAPGIDGLAEFPDGRRVLRGDGRRVAEAPEVEDVLADVHALLQVADRVKTEDGAELFAGKRVIVAHALEGRHQEARIVGHGDPRQLGDAPGALSHHLRGHALPLRVDHHRRHLGGLGRSEKTGALRTEPVHNRAADFAVHDNGLLGSADHPVVEGLAEENVVDRGFDVGALFDIDGDVSRSDADGGRSRSIGRLHHAHAARGQNQRKAGVRHEGMRHFAGRFLHPADAVVGRARRQRRLVDGLRRFDRALQGVSGRADDDGIARLEGDQALEHGRRSGIGDGGDAQDDAERFGEFHDPRLPAVLDQADGLAVADVVVDVFRGEEVLDDLVFDQAHARLLDRHAGQFDPPRGARLRGGGDDLVHRFLIVLREEGCGLPGLPDQFIGLCPDVRRLFGFTLACQGDPPCVSAAACPAVWGRLRPQLADSLAVVFEEAKELVHGRDLEDLVNRRLNADQGDLLSVGRGLLDEHDHDSQPCAADEVQRRHMQNHAVGALLQRIEDDRLRRRAGRRFQAARDPHDVHPRLSRGRCNPDIHGCLSPSLLQMRILRLNRSPCCGPGGGTILP